MSFLWNLIKRLVKNYDRHNISRLSAESTYYMILAIVPFIIFFMNILMFFAHSELPVVLNLLSLLPPESRDVIEPVVLELIESRSQTILSVGFLIAYWSTSRGINALIRALNIILNTEGKELSYVTVHIKSLLFTVASVITGFTALFLWVYGQAALSFVGKLGNIPPDIVQVWMRLTTWIPLAVVALSLAVFYRYAPNYSGVNRLNWMKTILSGIVGTTLWVAVTLAYRYYITDIANSSMTYGPLVGLMVLFVWLNLSVQAVLMGAEVTVAVEETILAEAKARLEASREYYKD